MDIRKLAKTSEMLNLFHAAKEFSTIQLFRNKTNLSKLQRNFLSYLYFYSDLYIDIGLKKVDEDILKEEIDEDAYMLWKRENPYSSLPSDKKDTGKDIHLVFSKPNKR